MGGHMGDGSQVRMGHLARKGVSTLAVCVALAAGVFAEERSERPSERQLAAQQAREARRAEEMRRVYRRQRSMTLARMRAHARMPNTMYASTPTSRNTDVSCPALADPATRRAHERWMRARRADPLRATERRFGTQSAPRVLPAGRAARTSAATVAGTREGDHGPVLVAAAGAAAAIQQTVPYFPSASNALGREGFARIVNHSDEAGTVEIVAVDDAGSRSEPLTLTIAADETKHFNSLDLEQGNPRKGLAGAAGAGQGGWRLELTSDLDIEALAYIRTTDGFLTAMHDTAPLRDGAYRVVVFNPGSNQDQASLLRLVNPGGAPASATIAGTDDRGVAGGEVSVEIPAGVSRTYTAAELESGSAPGLRGSLGDGTGKWRLDVSSGEALVAMSLLSSPTGHLTNLSTAPGNEAEGVHSVPLFPSAADMHGREGFVRVVNRADTAGEVSIEAFDDTDRPYPTLTLSIGAGETKHFNSPDLEDGNADKGLTGSTGAGQGDWRLQLSSGLDIEVLAYIRTTDGFLTAMHDVAPRTGTRHRVAVFNPGSNADQRSLLRLVNAGDQPAEVAIAGRDDSGASPGGDVALTVPAGASRTLTAQELESGGAGFTGALGDGARKWSLDVESAVPIVAMSLLSSPTGHLTNLSTAPGRDVPQETVAEVFRTLISPIVQGRCINCHVEGGASGNTRLVFVRDTDAGHFAKNLKVFEDFLAEEDDGADYILNKIQGALGHGGGIQVTAGTDEYVAMERFLGLLGEEVDTGTSVTVATLFDGVEMESWRSTLRRAAIVFAGRIPTEAEYTSIGGTDDALRVAIRGLMQGPEFHEFLLRASNDRLLTDREMEREVLPAIGFYVDFDNEFARLCEAAYAAGQDSVEWVAFHDWQENVQHGAGREPLELIAHIVENDLPYTQVLTADYLMANPFTARAYGSQVFFDQPANPREFRPARILSYYRTDESKVYGEKVPGCVEPVLAPGLLSTRYPHAGVLGTKSFLQRYPTTPTNRNRARARWAYYHFLDVDVEKSASRTTDPVALADTDNPTMYNPSCTVCHAVMDPVAATFQNYGADGLYKENWGGFDSLDEFYKYDPPGGRDVTVKSHTWAERETVSATGRLRAGGNTLGMQVILDPQDDYLSGWTPHLGIDYVALFDDTGGEVARYELEELDNWERNDCGHPISVGGDRSEGYRLWECILVVPVIAPNTGSYRVDVRTWILDDEGRRSDAKATLRIWVPGVFYHKGDTWYRDMREPGFRDETPTESNSTLQWLAEAFVEDRRFAEAAVKFWWPAIMGTEVAEPPEHEDDADFEGSLLASNAQAAEIGRMADGFRQGFRGGSPYILKDLLVEIVLSNWFRAGSMLGNDTVRPIALRDAGARRLLTPEELAQKTLALTGFQWGRRSRPFDPVYKQQWGAMTDPSEYRLLYGGIDSDGITERARETTPIMAGVAQSHALETSCPVVMREFYLVPRQERRLFGDVEPSTSPVSEFSGTFDVVAASRADTETLTLKGQLTTGPVTVRLAFLNDYNDERNSRDILLDRLRVFDGDEQVQTFAFEDLESHNCGHVEEGVFHLSGTGPECIIAVPVDIPRDGSYQFEIDAWADQFGDELAKLEAVVESDLDRSAGSSAIKATLVDLYEKLHGLSLSADAPEVVKAFDFFVRVWEQKREDGGHQFPGSLDCAWDSDRHYFAGIADQLWRDQPGDNGYPLGWDSDLIDTYFNDIDLSDNQGVAETWTVVLAYLLMDYRYLHL